MEFSTKINIGKKTLVIGRSKSIGFRIQLNGNKRGYAAAKRTRIFNWATSFEPINKAIKSGIKAVRERARELFKNNSYAKGYRNIDRANVVGHSGFILQNKAVDKNGELNETYNEAVEKAFARWGKKENCTMTKSLSFLRVQWLVEEQLKRDGEVLVRKITGESAGNPFGFSLELMDPEDLDHTFNKVLSNGNVVIMGIEFNQWKQPINYYVKKRNLDPDSYQYPSETQLEQIPASQMIHGFDISHPKQARGMSELSAAIMDLKNVDGWEQSSLVNARWNAMNMGFLEKKRIEGDTGFGVNDPDEDEDGDIVTNFEDGVIEELPFGYEFKDWKRQYPHDQHKPFMQSMGRKIASGLGVDYNTLFNDLESVNYSSLRSGKLASQDQWMIAQNLLREIFLIPVFEAWLKYALISGQIVVDGKPLKYILYDELNHPQFQPRRWQWVDPLKDMTAAKLAIESGLSTHTYELAKLGIDINDYVKTRKRELELFKKNGLTFNSEGKIELIEETGDGEADDGNKQFLKIAIGS